MQRVSIVGTSGAGKSTLANLVAEQIGVEVIDLDSLAHGPNWQPVPTPEFRMGLMQAISDAEQNVGGWVIPGNFRNVADLVQLRADTIVWLDLQRRTTIRRLIRRSIMRSVTREQVWGGNRESLIRLLSRDPQKNVVLWAWQTHEKYQQIYSEYASGDFWAHADVHRLSSSGEVDAFVASLHT